MLLRESKHSSPVRGVFAIQPGININIAEALGVREKNKARGVPINHTFNECAHRGDCYIDLQVYRRTARASLFIMYSAF